MVGSTPGSFYDLWGRLLARHWGKQISGSPEILVQNMPGVGTLTATQLRVRRSQTGRAEHGSAEQQRLHRATGGRKEVQFDLRKFQWIGSASQDSIFFTCGRYAV